MKIFLFSSVVLFACMSCGNHEPASGSEKDTTTAVTPANPPVAQMECFAYNSAKDTVTLNLTNSGSQIKGNLMYSYFEKDRNSGTLEGTYRGDTLIADYTFNSEGMSSIRQVAFLKTADGLVEGYGESEEKNGKMVFKNTGNLNFAGKIVLTKISCP